MDLVGVSLDQYEIGFSRHLDYNFSNQRGPLNFDQLFVRFVGHLLDFYEEYKIDGVDFFSIIFTSLDGASHFKNIPKNVNIIPFKENITNIKELRKGLKSSLLPLTLDESAYGKRSYSTRTYIDEIHKVKRVVTDIDSSKTRKDVFSLTNNLLVESYIDEKTEGDSFIRHHPKTKSSVTIRDNKIVRSTLFQKFPLITYKPPKTVQNTFNKHIGSFDMETYLNTVTGKIEVYCLGFCYGGNNVMISKPTIKTYYLDKGETSSDIVIECINEMLTAKYKNAKFYTHNLGGYDVVFILKILGDYNKKMSEPYFKLKAILRDNRILKLQISVKKSKSVTNTIFLVDSLALLPMSLSALAKGFSTKFEKPYFPYTFVTDKTLYYIGNTPPIEYYNTHKKDISKLEYLKLQNSKWNLREETVKYLESDLISLLQIMYEFSHHTFDDHNVQVSECLTITSLAVKIFLANHYHKKGNYLPLIKNKSVYADIKQGYYGGLSEVYRGYGENLNYYDVNSLYPHSAVNDMPGNISTFIETHVEEESLDIKKDNLFGFFYCDVKTTNDYFGLLPFRHKGLLTYPIGKFSG